MEYTGETKQPQTVRFKNQKDNTRKGLEDKFKTAQLAGLKIMS